MPFLTVCLFVHSLRHTNENLFGNQKQFKTLVLAFQTDQDTLSRRLEVQVNFFSNVSDCQYANIACASLMWKRFRLKKP